MSHESAGIISFESSYHVDGNKMNTANSHPSIKILKRITSSNDAADDAAAADDDDNDDNDEADDDDGIL